VGPAAVCNVKDMLTVLPETTMGSLLTKGSVPTQTEGIDGDHALAGNRDAPVRSQAFNALPPLTVQV